MPNKHIRPPNTWNNTNQHWIPQFILRGFDASEKASHVYEMDKLSGEIKLKSVRNIASRQGLLTERDDAFVRGIETQVARVIRRIRKGDLNITLEDRGAVDDLVLVLMHNDPYSGVKLAQLRESVTADMSREYAEAFRQHGGMIDLQDFKKLLADMFPNDFLEQAMTREVNLPRIALGLMGLRVHKTVKGEHLVIGDSPVLVLRAVYDGSPSLLHPGSQVILPINSRQVLVYRWITQNNTIQSGHNLDKDQARSLGKDYFHETDSRFVYGRTKISLKHTQAPQTKKRPIPHSAEVSDGWAAMYMLQEEISKQRVAEDKTEEQQRDTIVKFLMQNAVRRGSVKE